jgi:hypothetical protein
MHKKAEMRRFLGLPGAMLLCGIVLFFPAWIQAQQPKVSVVEGVSYNVNGSVADNLKSCIGKKVSVTLNSGKGFTGTVKEVGNHLVHVEKLEGKEYFDALILIEHIEAIDTRFRGEQR